jgi:hypothetical protein
MLRHIRKEGVVVTEYTEVGTGTTVFTDQRLVEGPLIFLDSPRAVIDFVSAGDVANTIVLARGGTTTFLTPALTAGVKGVITLQGAPESHLGILSREYGIPTVMGVTFTSGVRSSRGEVIPADGVRVRLDVSNKAGRVLVEPGAPVDDSPLPTPDAATAAMMEQVQLLLQMFQGTVPHGSAGDEMIRADFVTDVLTLTEENTHRDLSVEELNELLRYFNWNIWDFLALRATEGESGLIPRQEYECISCVHNWQRYPTWYRLILDRVGTDGLIDIGRTARREPANKVNLLHTWCTIATPLFGRGILGDLGIASTDDRAQDVRTVLQFARLLYKGLWGEGPMFASMRNYRAPVLDRVWLDRFLAEVQPLGENRELFTSFNAGTEMLAFLLYFDNRSGLNDSGPYDLGDGRFMIVRDHFLRDDMYHWHDVADGLPHCITQAMVFRPEGDLQLQLMDGATLFTDPGNYLQYLTDVAVYVRPEWDTPADQIRRIDTAEMQALLDVAGPATTKLYKRIANMSARDKIACGAAVYYAEFIAPFARAAGVWQEMLDEHDFWEWDETTASAYFPLVRDKQGVPMLGKLFLSGTGYPPLSAGTLTDVKLSDLHRLALRGMLPELGEGADAQELEKNGLIWSSPQGYLITEEGLAKHEELLAAERANLDMAAIKPVYERFLSANSQFKALNIKWLDADEDGKWALVDKLSALVRRIEPALASTTEVLPRFAGYQPRLAAAMEQVEDGKFDMLTAPHLDSVHTVWMELHEDYLRTLGISREEEGSY